MTEDGAQSFRCRGARHTSLTGMVMAFNPDDPHDGHATDALGFTYRIIHIGTELVSGVLANITGSAAAMPLFAQPVHCDPVLAGSLTALHRGLLAGTSALRRDELLTAAVGAMVQRAAVHPSPAAATVRQPGAAVAERARQVLHASVAQDITAGQLAAAAGEPPDPMVRSLLGHYAGRLP